MTTAIFVALGGAMGALARYGLSGLIAARVTSDFPWATLSVNALGSFLLGILFRSLEALEVDSALRGLLGVGLLGAFTTFSTFSLETYLLLRQGALFAALYYSLGSVLLGLVAVGLGVGAAGAVLLARAGP